MRPIFGNAVLAAKGFKNVLKEDYMRTLFRKSSFLTLSSYLEKIGNGVIYLSLKIRIRPKSGSEDTGLC